ncbi:MAG: PilT/PilU family type 4a pilus ATPase [Candidatus Omnitrophica bacterium]|nr:PilT/PilU family type 4a pilus ATPase [Candidatus Omnitrophota bacterium]
MPKIDDLFYQLIECNGSDLHLAQGSKPKIRINGKLTELDDHPVLTRDYISEILIEIAGSELWQRFQDLGDIDFAYELDNGSRFRSNYLRHFYGFGAVFRLIPSEIMTFEELQLPLVCKSLCELQSGLVLVTGPTGSGKSTTLAAIIDYINSEFVKKIITIEEPIEFLHHNKKCVIVHREVGSDTVSFSQGLRSALKSDANIILVGEMRDRETIELALTAAEMGILVFGTLHTNSAAKTIDRIVDTFPGAKKDHIREILANSLQSVVAQQLVPSADGLRRWAAFEILLRTTALPAIIRAGDTKLLKGEINTHSKIGMLSMDYSLLKLFQEGKITKEDAYLKALDKSLFRDLS